MAYIDKELFKQDIKMRYCNNCARPNDIKCRACHVDDMLGEIEDAPTADVVEVKHGEWLQEWEYQYYEDDCDEIPYIRCSLCGHEEWNIEKVCCDAPNYCSNCGADMRGVKNDNE